MCLLTRIIKTSSLERFGRVHTKSLFMFKAMNKNSRSVYFFMKHANNNYTTTSTSPNSISSSHELSSTLFQFFTNLNSYSKKIFSLHRISSVYIYSINFILYVYYISSYYGNYIVHSYALSPFNKML